MQLTDDSKKALILETLLQAAREEGKTAAQKGNDYGRGETMAWHRVQSIVLDEAEAYNLKAEDLGLSGFNPDMELLGIRPSKAA